MLIKGLTPEVIDSEFSSEDRAWVISDAATSSFVVMPDPRYTEPVVQFFMKMEDAEQYAREVQAANAQLQEKNLQPLSVKLKETMQIVMTAEPPCAIIVHSPNAMYQHFHDRQDD